MTRSRLQNAASLKEYREIPEEEEDEDVDWLRETQTHQQPEAVEKLAVIEKPATHATTIDAPKQLLAEKKDALNDEDRTLLDEADEEEDDDKYHGLSNDKDDDDDDDDEYQGLTDDDDDDDQGLTDDDDDDDQGLTDDDDDDDQGLTDDDDDDDQGLTDDDDDDQGLTVDDDDDDQDLLDNAKKEGELQGADHEKDALGLEEFFAQQNEDEDEDDDEPTIKAEPDEQDPSWLEDASVTNVDPGQIVATSKAIPDQEPSWLEDTSSPAQERPEKTNVLEDKDPSWLEDASQEVEQEEEYLWATDELEQAPEVSPTKPKKSPKTKKEPPPPDDWEDLQGNDHATSPPTRHSIPDGRF